MKYLVVFYILGFFSCGTIEQKATINYERKIINLGAIYFKKEYRSKIKIWNTGTGSLKILNTKSDCSCTVSNVPKDAVKPGDTSYIEFSITPKSSGYLQQAIAVENNSVNESLIQFLIRAKVIMN